MATKKLQIVDSLVKQAENADTLDGKHADEFAAASDVSALNTLVGDSAVSEQINAAIVNKVDKVVGTEGNAVVFGADGAIVDSGKTVHNIHIIPYYEPESITDAQKTTIANVIRDIRDDEAVDGEYAIYIRQGVSLLPAQTIVSGKNFTATAIKHDDNTYQYKITANVVVSSDTHTVTNVATSKELFFVEDIASNSTSNKAPSTKAVADYMEAQAPKTYVFTYDVMGTSHEANLAVFNEFLADYTVNNKVSTNVLIYVPDITLFLPVQSIKNLNGSWDFRANNIYTPDNNFCYQINCAGSGINCFKSEFVNRESDFNETSKIPASQKSTADWVNSAIATHNANTSAHSDIREQISQLSSEKVDVSNITQNTGGDTKKVMSQSAVTKALENLTTLPYGGSKEWLEDNGDITQLYQIDGYIWAYIDSTGWTRSGTQFLVVSSESEMTNEGGTPYLLRSGNSGTVYEYTEASGDGDIPVVDSIPDTANDGDVITIKPTEVSSTSEMIDTSKQYAINGKVWEYGETEVEKEPENVFVPTTATLNKRLGTSSESDANGSYITDYLEFDFSTATSFIVWLPLDYDPLKHGASFNYRIWYCDSSKAKLLAKYVETMSNIKDNVYIGQENGRYYLDISKLGDGSEVTGVENTKYIRISLGTTKADTAITVADIADVDIRFEKDRGIVIEYAWTETNFSTGRKYKATISTQDVPNFTNLATDVQIGRLNSSGGIDSSSTAATTVADYIDFVTGDVVRIKGLTLGGYNVQIYNSSKSLMDGGKPTIGTAMASGAVATEDEGNGVYKFTSSASSNVKYIRFSGVATGSKSDVIVTRNQPITYTSTTTVEWTDIGAYIEPTEAGWDATNETQNIIDNLSSTADSGATAVYSVDGYLYTYLSGASWMQSSKYTPPTLSVDGELSDSSTNAIENRVVKGAIDSVRIATSRNANDINAINAKIAKIETGSDTVTIPTFWQSAVDEVIAKIKALQVGRNCVTFPFFSDNHQRNGYAGILISHIMKECHIPYCFFGGDSITSGRATSYNTEADMITQDKMFDAIMSYIPNGRFCRAVGNHDGYLLPIDSTDTTVTDGITVRYNRDQVYDLFLREESVAQDKHFGEDGTYYYVDDIASKTRFVVLNTNPIKNESGQVVGATFDSTQLVWLQNTALSFSESGWAVVFISHQPISNHYHTGISNATEVRTAIANYINGTATNKADIVGWYSGHIHRDRIYTGVAVNTSDDSEGDAMPFKQVTITSDHTAIAYDATTRHPIASDDQSHAIDFVTINKNTRTVNITRLGVGEDRSYTY